MLRSHIPLRIDEDASLFRMAISRYIFTPARSGDGRRLSRPLVNGIVFALLYALTFETLGNPTWWRGAIAGAYYPLAG